MPRPQIIGTVIRRVDMNHQSSGKDKDYRITVSQEPNALCHVYYEHGPAGKLSQGGEKTSNGPVSVSKAMDILAKLSFDKQNQVDAYTVLNDQRFNAAPTQAAPKAPNPALRRPTVGVGSLSSASKALLANVF